MRRGGTFKVPEKVVAFKAMQSRHQDVLAWYQRGIIFNCHEQIETTWGKMCEDVLGVACLCVFGVIVVVALHKAQLPCASRCIKERHCFGQSCES